MFASFLLSQIALSGIPVALFVVMTIGVFVFALVAALVIGVVGALLFTAVCVGVALLVLLPTLFITSFAGAFIWLWGVGTYYILKWFNQKDIPGIHTSLDGEGDEKEGNKEFNESENLDALNGDAKRPPPKKEEKSDKKSNGVSGKLEKLPGGKQVGDVTKSTGVDDLADTGELTKKVNVDGVTKKVDVGNVTKTADVGNLKKKIPGGIL